MPFTLSHPAAVLLVRRTGLPVAAMVAGSMAPDVPLFLRLPGTSYAETHSLVGVVTLDVVLGLLGLVVWSVVLRDALVDIAPAPARERLAASAAYSRRQWLSAPVAVALGALMHVVWDSFTHSGRWGVAHVRWLGEVHAGLPGSSWAQYTSTVLGLALVATWAIATLRGRKRRPRPQRVPELGVRSLGAVLLTAGVLTAVAILPDRVDGLHAFVYRGATLGPVVVLGGLLTLAAVWQLRRGTASAGDAG